MAEIGSLGTASSATKSNFHGDVVELFAEADAALGFKKPKPDVDMLRPCIKAEKPSIWKRDILGRK